MNDRENILSIIRRQGYERMPVSFSMCPSLNAQFQVYLKEHPMEIPWDTAFMPEPHFSAASPDEFLKQYYPNNSFKAGTAIDAWGVGHEPGSPLAFHMTKMYHPMADFTSVEQILSYPMPVLDRSNFERMKTEADQAHARGQAILGDMPCTVWETSWYMRGMENLMCDMLEDDEMATVLLDRVTDFSVQRATLFAEAGADILFLGDDIGTQRAIMMSVSLYEEWLMPRLKRVIDAAKAVNPDIVIKYHSCGMVTGLIPSLIKAGVEVLNPVQPETMDFQAIHDAYGDQLSFNGTLGTQSVMPFGTPEDVRRTVFENLDIAGEKGGLLICPTHMLEPEVPLENVLAYIQACKDYK